METRRFKTNAKCAGCVGKIGERLSEILDADQWSIDLSSPDKVLTITSDKPVQLIIDTVKQAGFKAEQIE